MLTKGIGQSQSLAIVIEVPVYSKAMQIQCTKILSFTQSLNYCAAVFHCVK